MGATIFNRVCPVTFCQSLHYLCVAAPRHRRRPGPCMPNTTESPPMAAPCQRVLRRSAAAPDTLCDLMEKTTLRQSLCCGRSRLYSLHPHTHLSLRPRGWVMPAGRWCWWRHCAARWAWHKQRSRCRKSWRGAWRHLLILPPPMEGNVKTHDTTALRAALYFIHFFLSTHRHKKPSMEIPSVKKKNIQQHHKLWSHHIFESTFL